MLWLVWWINLSIMRFYCNFINIPLLLLQPVCLVLKTKIVHGISALCISWVHTGCFTTLGHTWGDDFLGFCDQKSSYKNVSDFGRLRSYGRFLIPVHALVWTVSNSWCTWDALLACIMDAADVIRNGELTLRATRAVHSRAAACVAAGGGIFENQL